MRKLKERNRRKQTLDAGVYPVVRLATKAYTYIHVVVALTKSMLLGHQVSSVNTITVTLAPGSTKEFHQEGWGSPRPPHKNVVAAPH